MTALIQTVSPLWENRSGLGLFNLVNLSDWATRGRRVSLSNPLTSQGYIRVVECDYVIVMSQTDQPIVYWSLTLCLYFNIRTLLIKTSFYNKILEQRKQYSFILKYSLLVLVMSHVFDHVIRIKSQTSTTIKTGLYCERTQISPTLNTNTHITRCVTSSSSKNTVLHLTLHSLLLATG